MNFLLITVGSHGDVHPFLAMGRALVARGHRGAVLTNPYYDAQIREAGLTPLAIAERVDLKDILTNSKIMDPHLGPIVVMRQFVLPMVRALVETTRRAIDEFRPDAAVIHQICIGSGWVCRQRGVPVAAVALAPCCWFNPQDTLVMPSFRGENPSPRMVRFDLGLGRVLMRVLMDPPLNRIRREMNLPPLKHIILDEPVSGDVNLGLWSTHFRGPVPGDPARGVICGFPWHDRNSEQETPAAELSEFLAAGKPPIVFSLGTAAVHTAGRFYHDAAEVCRLLNRRGLLLVGRPEYAPAELPEGVRAFTYAPFSQVLPRAAAVVHHGGIGTTAQALRSGRPTVVCPLSHDQFDNAARLARLGVSVTVKHSRVTAKGLAIALTKVLEEPAIALRAADVGRRIAGEDGAASAADALERLVSRKSTALPVTALD